MINVHPHVTLHLHHYFCPTEGLGDREGRERRKEFQPGLGGASKKLEGQKRMGEGYQRASEVSGRGSERTRLAKDRFKRGLESL